MLGTFANMFRIPELRKKILITLGILIVYRFGCLLPVPGLNVSALADFFAKQTANSALSQLFGMVTTLSGGALSKGTVFALGIMPYISATIIFQLLTGVVPALEKLRKEGESGVKKIRQWERYTTVGLCLVQGAMWVQYLSAMQHSTGGAPIFMGGMVIQITAILVMTTGTMLLMWLGDQITQFGIGNGISLIIMAGIIDRLPYSIYDLVRPGQHIEAGTVLFLIIAFVVVVGGVVLMTQGQRRIPVQQAKHTRGRRVYGGQRQYLPFRVNHSGVMPVIFASTLLLFPIMVANGLQNAAYVGDFFREVHTMLNRGTWLYVVLYVGLIYFFAYFWTSIVFKPKDLAENLQDYGSFIPGIRPGPRTAGYLEGIMTRITLAGATFLAIVAVIPQILQGVMGISGWMAGFYGGTSLLIVVGVALDLVEKIESHLMMRHYEGFMRKGKIRGRR